ncbi:MAG: anti-sigma factor antagonist [Lachnospiraceae bacterium]|nr:anti-sigma factor antagonist [Lachnospiraceae bacterium]
MDIVKEIVKEDGWEIALSGRVDSANSAAMEAALSEILKAHPDEIPVINAEGLEYISSAGLRVLLRLRKQLQDLRITEVSPEVYEIFDMTGFTEMMTIEKAYRRLSVEGCEIIGEGANGKVYRLDPETIIKVYKSKDALFAIKRERELARKAFVLGIPTAIPYDVVRVGDQYGSVFELLKSRSFAKILRREPERADELIRLSTELLRKIHAVELAPGELPDRKKIALLWTKDFTGFLPDDIFAKLQKMIEEIPDNTHLLHGDYHMKNIMLQDGEPCLIDMDTLSQGDPIFEFMAMYSAYIGFNELDHSIADSFLGIPFETCVHIFEETVRLYLGEENESRLQDVMTRATILGQVRILGRSVRRRLKGVESGDEQIARSREVLCKLVPKTERLAYEG